MPSPACSPNTVIPTGHGWRTRLPMSAFVRQTDALSRGAAAGHRPASERTLTATAANLVVCGFASRLEILCRTSTSVAGNRLVRRFSLPDTRDQGAACRAANTLDGATEEAERQRPQPGRTVLQSLGAGLAA